MLLAEEPFAGVGRRFREKAPVVDGARVILNNLRGRAVFAIPPSTDDDEAATWFTGHVIYDDDDASQWQLQVVAREEDCDGCIRCVQGGYQHYKLVLRDRRRLLRGEASVTRTGGDMLSLTPRDAANAAFEAETIFVDENAASIMKKYFPTLHDQATQGDPEELKSFVVVLGTFTSDQLILHPEIAPS